jgi:hypothetical protein
MRFEGPFKAAIVRPDKVQIKTRHPAHGGLYVINRKRRASIMWGEQYVRMSAGKSAADLLHVQLSKVVDFEGMADLVAASRFAGSSFVETGSGRVACHVLEANVGPASATVGSDSSRYLFGAWMPFVLLYWGAPFLCLLP